MDTVITKGIPVKYNYIWHCLKYCNSCEKIKFELKRPETYEIQSWQGQLICIVPYYFNVTLHTGRRVSHLLKATNTEEATWFFFSFVSWVGVLVAVTHLTLTTKICNDQRPAVRLGN